MTRRIAFGSIATAALVASLTLGFAQTADAQQGAAGTGAAGAGAAGANPTGAGAAGASPAGPGAAVGAGAKGAGGAGLEASPGKAGPAAKAGASAANGPDSQSAERPGGAAGRSGETKPSAQQSGKMQGDHPQTDAQTTGDRNRAGAGDTHRSTSSQINSEQQTRVHAELAHTHIREAPNLNVSLHIGASAPRTITEYWEPVPPTIINIVPAWSSYRVIRVGNEIFIIEPDTFAVVAVIEG